MLFVVERYYHRQKEKNDPRILFVSFVKKHIITRIQILIEEYLNQEMKCIKSW